MPFNFTFTGQFSTLSNFLSRLERFVAVQGDQISVNGRLLRVDGLSLKPAEDGWPGLQVNIAASSYIVPKGAAVPEPPPRPRPRAVRPAAATTTDGPDDDLDAGEIR